MGMGGGGAGGAIGAHVHDNNAGQGGNLTTATLLESVTLESRLDPNPADFAEEHLTSDDSTTSTTPVNSSLAIVLPNNSREFMAVTSAEMRTDSAGSDVILQIGGADQSNNITVASHDTAGRIMSNSTNATGTQTGQTLRTQWAVGAGNGTLRAFTNLCVVGVGS